MGKSRVHFFCSKAVVPGGCGPCVAWPQQGWLLGASQGGCGVEESRCQPRAQQRGRGKGLTSIRHRSHSGPRRPTYRSNRQVGNHSGLQRHHRFDQPPPTGQLLCDQKVAPLTEWTRIPPDAQVLAFPSRDAEFRSAAAPEPTAGSLTEAKGTHPVRPVGAIAYQHRNAETSRLVCVAAGPTPGNVHRFCMRSVRKCSTISKDSCLDAKSAFAKRGVCDTLCVLSIRH